MIKKFLQKLFPKFYSRFYFDIDRHTLMCPISSASDELKKAWYNEALEIFKGNFDRKNQDHLTKAHILNAKYKAKMHEEWGLKSLEGFFEEFKSEEKCN